MLNLRFELRGVPRKSDGLDLLRCTYYLDGRRCRFSTDLYAHPKEWDGTRQLVRKSAKRTPRAADANKLLRDARSRADEVDRLAVRDGRVPTRLDADHVLAPLAPVSKRVRSATSLLDYVRALPIRKGLAGNTAKKYATVAADLARFRPSLDWLDVSPTFYTDWTAAMRDRGLRDAALGKNVAVLKAAMREGQREGLHANEAYKHFAAPRKTDIEDARERVWLTGGQVRSLVTAALDHPLDYARDYFLTGVCSGQRYSDWAAVLDTEAEVTPAGTPVVNLSQRKTRAEVTVPLDSTLLAIRERRRTGDIPEVSYNTLRNHLAALGEHLGLPALTTHVARRTFGRLLWARGVDVPKIQVAYGHSTILETTDYLGLDREEVRYSVADELGALTLAS